MSRNQGGDLSIRPAAINQVPLILSFIHKLAEFEKLSDKVAADEESLRQSLFGPNPVAEVVFAYLAEEPVGFALYLRNFSTFLGREGIYLEDLFVDPPYRGRGIGTALFMYLAKVAKQRSSGRLEWAVLDWNQPAIDFYRSLGATPMHEWTIFRLTGRELEQLAARTEQPR
jgi:GNAT superfamily N-acetyltransferase